MPARSIIMVRHGRSLMAFGARGRRRPSPARSWLVLLERCGLRLLQILCKQLLGPQVERQLVDLPGRGERHLVVLVLNRRARIDSDIKALIPRPQKGDGMGNLLGCDDLTIRY